MERRQNEVSGSTGGAQRLPEENRRDQDRLERSARIQEGEQPAEDPSELPSETDRIYARLLELISAINRMTVPVAKLRADADQLAKRYGNWIYGCMNSTGRLT